MPDPKEDWTALLTAEERERLPVEDSREDDESSAREFAHTVATLRALVEEYRATLEARRTQYMAPAQADNTVEIATLGWALAELNAFTEEEMLKQLSEGGLSCPACEKADHIDADTGLLEACRKFISPFQYAHANMNTQRLARELVSILNKRLEVK